LNAIWLCASSRHLSACLTHFSGFQVQLSRVAGTTIPFRGNRFLVPVVKNELRDET
jgi:hypothetical protein